MRLRRFLALTAAGLLLIAGGYAGYSAIRSHRSVSVAPSGPYAVGRTVREWQDRSRYDMLGRLGGQPRILSVWLWYPVARGTRGTPAAYAPGAWSKLHKFGIGETDFGRISTGTLLEAPIAAGVFPIVVLLPGMGFAAPQYASIAASLAARGYVVAGVTPTYSANLTVLDEHPVPATADGDPSRMSATDAAKLVGVWSADARFVAGKVADAYQDHVDARHTVYAGHSFGGAAALEACRQDVDCAGAADLDGTPYGPVAAEGLSKPMLLLCSGTGGADGDESTRRLVRASTGPVYAYTIEGALHFDFTDYAAYHLAAPLRLLLPLGTIDGRRALTITNGYLGGFADRAARGSAWTAPTYPEARPVAMPGG